MSRVINPELLNYCNTCREKKQYGRFYDYQHCSRDSVHQYFECAQCQAKREAAEKVAAAKHYQESKKPGRFFMPFWRVCMSSGFEILESGGVRKLPCTRTDCEACIFNRARTAKEAKAKVRPVQHSLELILKLHLMDNDETPEADAVRDEMDWSWQAMDKKQQDLVRAVSAALNVEKAAEAAKEIKTDEC